MTWDGIEVVGETTDEPEDMEYLSGGEPLATWWVQATPGSGYWRCTVPARALPGRVLVLNMADIYDPGGDEDLQFPAQVGPAIWQFPGNTTRALVMAEMQRQGIRTLVEVDDNYTMAPPALPGVKKHWSHKINPEFLDDANYEAHRKIASWADGVIVSTEPLAEIYREINQNVYVCPNSVDPADWPIPEKPEDGILRIGYAYSDSHYYDMILVAEALEWASKQQGVEVWLMGNMTNPLFNKIRYHQIPWTNNLAEYRRNLQILDVGLCPLMPGKWANCKSDIKAMEYAMAGALPVVSEGVVYDAFQGLAIRCGDGKHWLRLAKWCVTNRDLLRDQAKFSREYVLRERTIDKSIHLWKEALCVS